MPEPLDDILGPIKVGYAVATCLFGVVTAQTYIYYRGFTNDPPRLKLLVTTVWLAECAHQLCLGHTMDVYVVKSFGLAAKFSERPPVSLIATVGFTAIVTLLVTGFFVYRLWRSTQKVIHAAIIAVLLTAWFITTCVLGRLSSRLSSLDVFLQHYKLLILAQWSCSAAVDVSLTVALCSDMFARRRSVLYRTARIIDRLMMWCVATGMITSISAVAMAICFSTLSVDNRVFMGIYFTNSRLSSNSLLAALNLRRSLRRIDSSTGMDMGYLSTFPQSRASQPNAEVRVHVAVTTEIRSQTGNMTRLGGK
ncbi:hypothetical protein Hypma_004719 [Hypsizygus marmoreus]|uniref:DUF6534 domain-containing protein n=1 Tax=Hypsizygus marmoreus TaxID=39966 RepID=A0A369J1M9_HYPMA|nr:hypothetical protein Hypma_004719 [Hypsizygus marmoreus]